MNERRDLLKVLGVSGATGAAWSKPVVDSVILPAHAVASCAFGWVNGDADGPGSDETQLEGLFQTRCDCEEAVREQYPDADGATWGWNSGNSSYQECYAEFNWACPDSSSSSWETKSFEGIDCPT